MSWTVKSPAHHSVTGEYKVYKDAIAEAKRLNEKSPGHYVVNDEGEVDWQPN